MKKMIAIGILSTSLSGIYGMNVQGNSSDEFGRRITEIMAGINEQHKREMAELIAQNTAERQVLLNKLDEQKLQIKEIEIRHQAEQQELRDQIKLLLDQRDIEQAKVAALERSNVLAQKANEAAKEKNRLEAQKIKEAQDRENARNAEKAKLQNQIDSKIREIHHLDVTYIHIPPQNSRTYDMGILGYNAEYTEFLERKENAKRRIPQLEKEIEDLQQRRNAL